MMRIWRTWTGVAGLAADALGCLLAKITARALQLVDEQLDCWGDEVEQVQQPAGRPPSEQWWCINGSEILDALHRARAGDDPDLVYLELYANSDSTDYGKEPNE